MWSLQCLHPVTKTLLIILVSLAAGGCAGSPMAPVGNTLKDGVVWTSSRIQSVHAVEIDLPNTIKFIVIDNRPIQNLTVVNPK